MSCCRVVITLAGWLACTASGCSLPMLQTSRMLAALPSWKHPAETRAVQQFTTALEQDNLSRLREATSAEFQRSSLSHDGAISDLKLLNLPSGEVTILEVTETTSGRWDVLASVGSSSPPVTYVLVKNPRTHTLVVDDVRLTKNLGGGRGEVTQTATAQLNFLQAGRRFLNSWNQGTREELLAVTTAEFRQELVELPPSFLARLTRQVADDRRLLTSFRPESRMDGDRGAMIFRRSSGTLLLEMKRVDGAWLVNDAAVHAQRDTENLPSARRLARTLRTAADFLTAYQERDQETLRRTSHPGFYEGCLRASDPDVVPLPVDNLLAGSFELRTHGETVDLLLSHHGQTYLVTLAPQAPRSLDDDTERSTLPKLVQEVTLYESDGAQVKTLTSIYTSRVVVQMFAQALMMRDLQRLTYFSSPDFNTRVWQQCDENVLIALPFEGIDLTIPEVISTVFHGPVTEITVTQGRSALTYVLKTDSSRLQVDDILIPLQHRPGSLKSNLALLIPIYRFAYAIHGDNREQMARVCAPTLARTCTQLPSIPNLGCSMVDHLLLPVASVHPAADRTVVKLGDSRFGTEVTLRNEANRWRIEDIAFITGNTTDERIELMAAWRRHNAQWLNMPATTPNRPATTSDPFAPEVLPASAAFPAE